MAFSLEWPLKRVTSKLFYGWWVVVASTISTGLYAGIYYYGSGVFFLPLLNEFGSSRAVLSGAFSLARLETGILGPIQGYAADRWGPRPLMFIGTVLLGAGMLIMTRVPSLTWFYVVFGLMVAVGASLAFGSVPLTAVANWFVRRRGLALGIALSGVGLGAVMTPILGWVVENHGWRTAAVVSAAIIWALGVPLALVMRHKPEPYGMQPDGERPAQRLAAAAPDEEVDFSPVQALRTRAFWLLSLFFTIRILITSAVAIHLVAYYTELGGSAQMGAVVLGLIGAVSVPGRLGFGWLGDRWSRRHLLALVAAFTALSMLLLATVPYLWVIPLFLIPYAPSDGASSSLMFSMRAEYFGRKAYATIGGFMSLMMLAGGVSGPVLAGYIADTTDSYRLLFYIFAAVSLVTLVLAPLATRPRLRPG